MLYNYSFVQILCKLLCLYSNHINMNCTISIYLDRRRAKEKKKFPVKLRVYAKSINKTKLYPIDIDLTEKEFESIWQTEKPREIFKPKRIELQKWENLATDVAKELKTFTFEKFEKKMFRNTGEGNNVFFYYDQIIAKYKKANRIGTAQNYELSKKSLKAFLKHKTGIEIDKISFSEISSQWLSDYETYMIDDKKRSVTTVGIYLRPLQAVFNVAISENEIEHELYPFGKKKYQIPSARSVKKALDNAQLTTLFHAETNIPEQAKARDFWFFSYSCNGINIKDIVQLKFENISDDTLTLYRAKTINTTKKNRKPITIYISEFAKNIIEKYGNENTDKKQYIFPILDKNNNATENHRRIKNFTKFINQNIKKLAENNGITKEISTYWARHSFATNAIRKGASMEFVSEALSHNNLKTTQGYFAGFEESSKRELMKDLMNF